MTRKQDLEQEKKNLESQLKEVNRKLDFLNSSPANQITTILNDNEHGIIIIESENQGSKIVRIKCRNPSDFSMSFDDLQALGYCMRSIRKLSKNVYNVWFYKFT